MASTIETSAASSGARLSATAGRLVDAALAGSLPRFFAVGVAGLATDATVFTLASRAGAADWLARAVSLAIATLVTWRLNRRFTFGASGRRVAEEATRYAAVALAAQGFNWGLFLTLRSAVPHAPPLAALLASAICAAGFSFVGQRSLTFSRAGSIPAADRSSR